MLWPPHPFPCSLQHLSSHLCGGWGWCGSLPQCNERYQIGIQNNSSNAHWVARHLVTAGGKSIKTWLRGMAVTVAITPTARQRWIHLSSNHRNTLHALAATSISLLTSTSKQPSLQGEGGGWCGSLPQCNERYQIGAQNSSSNAHWVARHLATAGGKSIKMWLPGTPVTVAVTPTARQRRIHLSSNHRLARALQTALTKQPRPALLWQHRPAANIARTGLGQNLHSHLTCQLFQPTSPSHRREARMTPQSLPSLLRSSALAFACTQTALFSEYSTTLVTTFTACQLPARPHIQPAQTVV
jgi:hypothetical protein